MAKAITSCNGDIPPLPPLELVAAMRRAGRGQAGKVDKAGKAGMHQELPGRCTNRMKLGVTGCFGCKDEMFKWCLLAQAVFMKHPKLNWNS